MPSIKLIKDLKHHDAQEVCIQGWMYGKRSGGKILFLLLRDGTGVCQCIVEATLGDDFLLAKSLNQESSLRITGTVHGVIGHFTSHPQI